MKVARYISLIEPEPGTWLAFSHTHGRLIRVTPSTRAFLEKGSGPLGLLQHRRLEAAGFLVPSREAELDFVRHRLFAHHYSRGIVTCSAVLSFACNLRCPYCYEQGGDRGHESMSPEVARQVVRAVQHEAHESGASVVGLALYGGEPLVNLRCATLLTSELGDWCRDHHVELAVNLITNGTLLTRKAIRALKPALRKVQLTLEGSPEHHDRVRIGPNGKGTFKRILTAAETALDEGLEVALRIQLSPDGWRGAEECVAALHARGLARHPGVQIYFFPILDLENVCTVKQAPCYRAYFSREMLRELWEIGLKYQGNVFHLPQPVWEQPYCSYVNNHAWLVDPRGRKYKCVSVVGRDDSVTGSVVEQLGITDRLRCQARELDLTDRLGPDFERCRDCEILPSCDGGCAYRAFSSSGTWRAPSCELLQDSLTEKIAYFYRFLRDRGEESQVETI